MLLVHKMYAIVEELRADKRFIFKQSLMWAFITQFCIDQFYFSFKITLLWM